MHFSMDNASLNIIDDDWHVLIFIKLLWGEFNNTGQGACCCETIFCLEDRRWRKTIGEELGCAGCGAEDDTICFELEAG